MPNCAICGEHDGLNNKCNYCGRSHCKAHTLPENHRCVGLRSGGWEKYKEARQKRNADHPKSPVEKTDNTSSASNDNSYGREWSTTPAKKKKRSHSGWWKSDKQESETKSTKSTGDDSPPVKLKSDGGGSTEKETNTWRVLYSHAYNFFHRFGEIITSAFLLATGTAILFFSFLFSKRGFAVFLTLALAIGAYSAVVGTGIDPIDNTVSSAVSSGQGYVDDLGDNSISTDEEPQTGQASSANADNSNDQDQTESAGTALDTEKIESSIHREINNRRQERGLSPLTYDEHLEEIAQFHSDNMVSEGFFAHDSPSGLSMSDRYDRFNYNCRVKTGENTYAGGAENIAYTYAGQDVMRDSGRVTNHNFNETSIGRELVNQWMNSSGHRENIMRQYWRNEGIGVTTKSTSEGVRVYATQNFC